MFAVVLEYRARQVDEALKAIVATVTEERMIPYRDFIIPEDIFVSLPVGIEGLYVSATALVETGSRERLHQKHTTRRSLPLLHDQLKKGMRHMSRRNGTFGLLVGFAYPRF